MSATPAVGRLHGRHVLVTGAAGTIGRSVCEALLAEGAALTATDLPGPALDALHDRLPAGSAGAGGDGADPSTMSRIVAEAAARRGPVDGLAAVAGAWEIVDFVDSDLAQWQRMIAGNLLTALSATRAVLPGMCERGEGSIALVASTAGEFGSVRPSAAYAAAKAGVIGLTKSLAREVSPRGVRINAVSPGPIDTPALQAATPAAQAEVARRTLLGRAGRPHEIADGIVFLLSAESSFMTGAVLQVNGGSLL